MSALQKELLRIAIFTVGVALLLQVATSGVVLNFVMMALYAALLAQAWNILGGFGGQFSFGHALFFGTGAYVQAIAQVQFGINPWAALPLAVLASSAAYKAIITKFRVTPELVTKGMHATAATNSAIPPSSLRPALMF